MLKRERDRGRKKLSRWKKKLQPLCPGTPVELLVSKSSIGSRSWAMLRNHITIIDLTIQMGEKVRVKKAGDALEILIFMRKQSAIRNLDGFFTRKILIEGSCNPMRGAIAFNLTPHARKLADGIDSFDRRII